LKRLKRHPPDDQLAEPRLLPKDGVGKRALAMSALMLRSPITLAQRMLETLILPSSSALCTGKHIPESSASNRSQNSPPRRTQNEQILQTVCKPGLIFGKEQKENL
jgi:hypothetical protein